MNRATPSRLRRHTERGVAAVEFAILLPLLITLLAAPLYIGRVLWHYTVIQKAAHDAVLYLSTVPEVEMRTPVMTTAARTLATDLANAEMSDLPPGNFPPAITIECDGVACDGYVAPSKVRVFIRMRVQNPFFETDFGGVDGIVISSDAEMVYLGSQ